MSEVLFKTAGPAGLALPGMSHLESCPSHILYLFLKTKTEISLPLIITWVCSVPPWSEVKAIVLETPLYSRSKAKVRVIQTQKYNSSLFPVQGNWKFCTVIQVSHASFGYFPQAKELRRNQVWEFLQVQEPRCRMDFRVCLLYRWKRYSTKRKITFSRQIQGLWSSIHLPQTTPRQRKAHDIYFPRNTLSHDP